MRINHARKQLQIDEIQSDHSHMWLINFLVIGTIKILVLHLDSINRITYSVDLMMQYKLRKNRISRLKRERRMTSSDTYRITFRIRVNFGIDHALTAREIFYTLNYHFRRVGSQWQFFFDRIYRGVTHLHLSKHFYTTRVEWKSEFTCHFAEWISFCEWLESWERNGWHLHPRSVTVRRIICTTLEV